MSRSGYSDDWSGENWDMIRWQGALKSAIRGKRGQAFLRELLSVLDGMQKKELIAEELKTEGGFCALGAIGQARGVDLDSLNAEDWKQLAETFGIAEKLVQEIMFRNDECLDQERQWGHKTDAEYAARRWRRMQQWVKSCLVEYRRG